MMLETDAIIRSSVVSGNLADGSGGGVYVRGQGNPEILNCLFTFNQAGRDGGGLSTNWYAITRVNNCTFTGNLASGTTGAVGHTGFGGAVFCGYESVCTIANSILTADSGLKGDEIAVGSGFELDSRPGRVDVSYTDIAGKEDALYTEKGCVLNLGSGIISKDPLFVDGPLGSYYLSQARAGQDQTSPCVDAGGETAGGLGLSKYTTSTKGQPDIGMVDLGYHSPIIQPCKLCDIVRDGVIDFSDYAKLASEWMRGGCSEGNSWCNGADVTFDGAVNAVDLQELADCWLVSDTMAPLPNPPQWKTEPHRIGLLVDGTVEMVAKSAEDAWGWKVEYYFDCFTGDGHDSGWQVSSEYHDLLPRLKQATYRFKVRDELGNETAWSKVVYVAPVTGTCEAPSGALNLVAASTTSYAALVTGNRLTDPDGVQYYFECEDATISPSGWIEPDPNLGASADPNFQFTGLKPSTQYRFRYKARDKASELCQPLETQWSAWLQVTTPSVAVPDVIPPTPNPMTWDATDDPNTPVAGWGGQPIAITADGGATYSARMTATVATDASGSAVEYYFAAMNGSKEDTRFSSGWIASNTYTVLFGPHPGNYGYSWKVRARDQAHNMTGWSTQVAPP